MARALAEEACYLCVLLESEFLEDMDALGCRRPDVMTRVSEYMTEIVEYIQTIMSNNMAYESNGSVHFDTQAFRYMHLGDLPTPDHQLESKLTQYTVCLLCKAIRLMALQGKQKICMLLGAILDAWLMFCMLGSFSASGSMVHACAVNCLGRISIERTLQTHFGVLQGCWSCIRQAKSLGCGLSSTGCR